MTTLNWYDRNNKQREAVAIYRKPEQEVKEDVMNDFLSYLKYDHDEELTQDQLANLTTLINAFLGVDMEKVKQGEKEMLQRWINGQNVQSQDIVNVRLDYSKKK